MVRSAVKVKPKTHFHRANNSDRFPVIRWGCGWLAGGGVDMMANKSADRGERHKTHRRMDEWTWL